MSTVHYAADADYQLVVIEDGCADWDPEVHALLMEKIFPRQATVTTSGSGGSTGRLALILNRVV